MAVKKNTVGYFVVTGNRIIVIDPVFGTDVQTPVFEDVKQGIWRARVQMQNTKNYGWTVTELFAVNTAYRLDCDLIDNPCLTKLFVDSHCAGIFDIEQYPQGHEAGLAFFERVHDATRKRRIGVILDNAGVAVGYTSKGSYPVYSAVSNDGAVIGVKISFNIE